MRGFVGGVRCCGLGSGVLVYLITIESALSSFMHSLFLFESSFFEGHWVCAKVCA